jgi:hypothetical protein
MFNKRLPPNVVLHTHSSAQLCVALKPCSSSGMCAALHALQVRKLLDTEATISLEAKAALEEAQCALAAAKSEAAQQLAKLRRELDSRNERIRKLEAQLRGAYSGLSRAAVRSSMAAAAAGDSAGVCISRVGLGAVAGDSRASLEDVSAGLGPHENVIELVVAEAVLTVSDCSLRVKINMSW